MISKDRIGIFVASTGIDDSEELLSFIKKRTDLIQIWTMDPTLTHLKKTTIKEDVVLREVAQGYIRISSLGGYMDWTIPENNQDRKAEFFRLINSCPKFHTNIVCTEAGRTFTDRNDPIAWQTLIQSMRALCDHAEKNSVYIALELGKLDLVFYPEEYTRLKEEVGSSTLKINFDPANLVRGQLDPIEVLEQLVDDVVHVHVKDANSDRMCPLTKGDVDFLRLIEILEGNGYKGSYIIEQEHNDANRKDAIAEDFERFLDLLYH